MAKATVPPIDTDGEMHEAGTLLKRFRRQLSEQSGLGVEWQRYVAQSLLEGIKDSTEPAK